ncbi:MAG TPA: PHB depolymerase family esterase, partial [Polyangia bacterium]|nr:PHB depolymerase family esterase [Polyangia bacterium]
MRRALLAAALCLAAGTAARAADPEVHVLPVADRAPGERVPLLVYLHGLGGSGSEALAAPALRALAERGRMVLVAPDGNLDREGRRFWNAGGACCNFDGKAVNDVARLEALISRWLERPEIDPARVYVVGFSNGGFMAHRLACFMDDRLAAVVSIGGAGRARDEACAPASPISVLEVHGDADPVVRYDGGRIFNDRALDP